MATNEKTTRTKLSAVVAYSHIPGRTNYRFNRFQSFKRRRDESPSTASSPLLLFVVVHGNPKLLQPAETVLKVSSSPLSHFHFSSQRPRTFSFHFPRFRSVSAHENQAKSDKVLLFLVISNLASTPNSTPCLWRPKRFDEPVWRLPIVFRFVSECFEFNYDGFHS